MRFIRHIGIDYSGAQTMGSRLSGLQVYESREGSEPARVKPPAAGVRHWTRLEVAQYCLSVIRSGEPSIIGIDHGFSFPMAYMKRYAIRDWDHFLVDFMRHWPTADPDTTVDSVRYDNQRAGDRDEFRLCERWTTSAKSVFHFDVQGQVAKSTHAGLPWLLWLRESSKREQLLHFWPFDGFEIPEARSVIAEMYPSMFRRRYPDADRSADEHDAYCLSAWLSETDRRGQLDFYARPPLAHQEQQVARLEGWIFGVC